MQPSVFISYRRADTGGHAGRLFDRLSRWFDAGEVFFDVDTFDAGEVFPEGIERAIRAAKVVLVVIGPGWLEDLNTRAAGRQTDYVRQEVAVAIHRQAADGGVLVLPVLMGGAGMPSREALHSDLRGEIGRLSDYQAHTFQGNQAEWDRQFVRLREAIARVGGVPKPRFRSPSEVEQPYHVLDDLLSFHFQDPENRLQELHESLEARSGVAAVARSALHGMGGVGKTQLALKYTLDYRDRYAGVWWFRAESEGALQADAGKLCEHAKVFVPDGERPSQALKRWLERERRAMAAGIRQRGRAGCASPPSAAGRKPSLDRDLAQSGLGRDCGAGGARHVWTTEQGVRFLAGRLSGGDREEPAALVEDLGGLPLALEQAASYLEATGVTAGVYRRLLDGVDTEGDILDETEGSSATGYGRSVAKTLSVAFEKLSPPGRRLLRLCAFAAPEPVPEWLFREAGDRLSGFPGRYGWGRRSLEQDRGGAASLRAGRPYFRRGDRTCAGPPSLDPTCRTNTARRTCRGSWSLSGSACLRLYGRSRPSGSLAALRGPGGARDSARSALPARLPRSRESCRVAASGGPFPPIPLVSVHGCRSFAPKVDRHREQAVGRYAPGDSREHEQPCLDAPGAGRSGRSCRSAGTSGAGVGGLSPGVGRVASRHVQEHE